MYDTLNRKHCGSTNPFHLEFTCPSCIRLNSKCEVAGCTATVLEGRPYCDFHFKDFRADICPKHDIMVPKGGVCTLCMDEYDVVDHPKHYNSHPSGIECIQITRHMNFNIGNAVKYLWRTDHKNGIEDLKKAAWYIADEIKRLEGAK